MGSCTTVDLLFQVSDRLRKRIATKERRFRSWHEQQSGPDPVRYVVLDHEVRGVLGSKAPPGRYAVRVNLHGAVSVILPDDTEFGVKPGEYRWDTGA